MEGNLIQNKFAHIGIGNRPEQQLTKIEIYKGKKFLYRIGEKELKEIIKQKKVIYYKMDGYNLNGCLK